MAHDGTLDFEPGFGIDGMVFSDVEDFASIYFARRSDFHGLVRSAAAN
jgi:hypothetical protein